MDAVTRALGQNLRILSQVLGEGCVPDLALSATDASLSRNQVTMLRVVGPHGCFPIGKIALALGISNSAASKNVDHLQQLGFVQRVPSPEDRRSQRVCLLEPGRAFVAKYAELAAARADALFAGFEADEKTLLLSFMQRLIRCALVGQACAESACWHCVAREDDHCVVEEFLGTCARRQDPSGTSVDHPGGEAERPLPRCE